MEGNMKTETMVKIARAFILAEGAANDDLGTEENFVAAWKPEFQSAARLGYWAAQKQLKEAR
jgi:hypothetical protein